MIEFVYRFEKEMNVQEEKIVPNIPLEIVTLQGEIDLTQNGLREEILNIRGEYGLGQFRDRLAQGNVLFLAISNGKLAGFIWFCAFPVKGAGYHTREDEAYHIDGWTFESFRGKGVLPVLQQAVFDYIRSNYSQVRILISHASCWNKPSIAGQQKAGLIPVARELSFIFLGYNHKFHVNKVKGSLV